MIQPTLALATTSSLSDWVSLLYLRLQRADPSLLVELAKSWSSWGGVAALGFGLFAAGFGSRGIGRRVAIGSITFAIGWTIGAHLPLVGLPKFSAWIAAGAFGAAGFFTPAAGAAAAGAFAGAWLGAVLFSSGPRPLLQLGFGFLFGMAAAFMSRRIAAVATAIVGAVLAVVGAIALLPGPLQDTLATYPAAPLLPIVVIASAGAAYQLARRPPLRLGRRRFEREGAEGSAA